MVRSKSQWSRALPRNQESGGGFGLEGRGECVALGQRSEQWACASGCLVTPGARSFIHSHPLHVSAPFCLLQTSPPVGVGRAWEEAAVTGSKDRAREWPVRKLRESSLLVTPLKPER